MKLIAFLMGVLFSSVTFAQIKTFDELEKFIRKNPRSSVDDILNLLDTKIKKKFAITYHGEGLLGASPDNPTIILMSDSYKEKNSTKDLDEREHLWLAFRASSKGENAHLIDVLRWNPIRKKTELKQIVYQQGNSKIVNEPISCQGCHRGDHSTNNARVLWGNYPFWPGSIGSYGTLANLVNWAGNPRFKPVKKEQELLDKYVEDFNSKHLRFKFLPNFKEVSTFTSHYFTGVEGYAETNLELSVNSGNFNFIGAQNKLLKLFEQNCRRGRFDKKEVLDFIDLSLSTSNSRLEAIEDTLNEKHFMGGNYVVATDYTKNHLYDLLISSYDTLDPSGEATQDFVSSFDQKDDLKQLAFLRQAAWNFSYTRMRNSRMFLYFLEIAKLPISLVETTMTPSRGFGTIENKIEFFIKNSDCLKND